MDWLILLNFLTKIDYNYLRDNFASFEKLKDKISIKI